MTTFYEDGLVDLLVPGAERRAARVKAIGHGQVLLTLMGPPADSAAGPAALELVDGEGVDHVEGYVTRGEDPRALTFEPTDPVILPQRRDAPRVQLEGDVLIERPGGISSSGRIVDLSSGGVRLRTADELALGRMVWLTFASENRELSTSGAGRVVRADADGEYAVEFLDWPEGERTRLAGLMQPPRDLP